ncbi:MAG: zinc metalloprotease HtpX [Acidimicrobiia bacterium]|nr:zinc metalloprotease HtpX [Acidimicrobiia bacterium]
MNNVKTVGLMALLGAALVGLGGVLGGQSMAAVALGIAVLMNGAMYFFSDKIALKSTGAVPVAENELPNVYTIVRSLAQRENMPMPKIYLINSPQPNAFATGRNPNNAAVAVTRGIVDMMEYTELEGVLAHELAHVRNRDILIGTIAATIGAALSFLARFSFWTGGGRRDGGNAIIGLVALILAPLGAVLVQSAISRSREFQADATGAESTGSPLALASALAKIDAGTSRIPMDVNPAVSQLFIADPLKAFGRGRDRRGALAKRFSTHPPTAERIDRLEKMAMGGSRYA